MNGYCVWDTQGEIRCRDNSFTGRVEGFSGSAAAGNVTGPCKEDKDCAAPRECQHMYNPSTKTTRTACVLPSRCTPPNKPCKCPSGREAQERLVDKKKHFFCVRKAGSPEAK